MARSPGTTPRRSFLDGNASGCRIRRTVQACATARGIAASTASEKPFGPSATAIAIGTAAAGPRVAMRSKPTANEGLELVHRNGPIGALA